METSRVASRHSGSFQDLQIGKCQYCCAWALTVQMFHDTVQLSFAYETNISQSYGYS